jgi:hypothetical protein
MNMIRCAIMILSLTACTSVLQTHVKATTGLCEKACNGEDAKFVSMCITETSAICQCDNLSVFDISEDTNEK